jgi:hypothetical protein
LGGVLIWNFTRFFALPLVGNVQYHRSRTVSLDVGYRALSMDYEQGSGNDQFRFDMILHGPVLGAMFHF